MNKVTAPFIENLLIDYKIDTDYIQEEVIIIRFVNLKDTDPFAIWCLLITTIG